MRRRLRPAHSPGVLAAMYARPHDHTIYGRGHGERVDETIRLGRSAAPESVADLSCGNAAVARALHASPILGDVAPGYPITGPIEETVGLVGVVDLFVMGETLEHLDDPDAVLAAVRARCNRLIVSTPVGAGDDSNAEHYWSWDRDDVAEMLASAGFTVDEYREVDSTSYGEPYCYGIWLCH